MDEARAVAGLHASVPWGCVRTSIFEGAAMPATAPAPASVRVPGVIGLPGPRCLRRSPYMCASWRPQRGSFRTNGHCSACVCVSLRPPPPKFRSFWTNGHCSPCMCVSLRPPPPLPQFGSFWTNGQICSSTSRLLIHKSISAAFLARLKLRAEAIDIGDPLVKGRRMGPVVSLIAAHLGT